MSALSVPQSTLPAADERLAQMVTLAIRQRAVRVPAEFTVLAHQSTVTLRGRTRTFYEKQLLLHAVQRVPGVRQIRRHCMPDIPLPAAITLETSVVPSAASIADVIRDMSR